MASNNRITLEIIKTNRIKQRSLGFFFSTPCPPVDAGPRLRYQNDGQLVRIRAKSKPQRISVRLRSSSVQEIASSMSLEITCLTRDYLNCSKAEIASQKILHIIIIVYTINVSKIETMNTLSDSGLGQILQKYALKLCGICMTDLTRYGCVAAYVQGLLLKSHDPMNPYCHTTRSFRSIIG